VWFLKELYCWWVEIAAVTFHLVPNIYCSQCVVWCQEEQLFTKVISQENAE
jgi:hypothetical protein